MDSKHSKRRLPLVTEPPRTAGDGGPPRPAWQWVGLGAVAILGLWVPLSAGIGAVATRLALASSGDERRLAAAQLGVVGMHALALALASAAGGGLVGRWGGETAGASQAALSGLAAALIGVGATWMAFGPSPGGLVVLAVSVPSAAIGGWIGVRARARAR